MRIKRIHHIFLLTIFAWLTVNPTVAGTEIPASYKDVPIPDLQWKIPEFREFSLDNGIEGLVVEDDEVPLVYFSLVFPAPPDPEDKVGLAEMAAWTLRNGGGTNMTADSINDLIEYKAAWLGVWAGQEQFRISGSGHKDDLPLLLNIVEELILNPAYPEDKIDLKRSTMLEVIRRRNDRPNGIAHREISRLIYPDHPWGRETSKSTVEAIRREDLLDYHRQVFNPTRAVIGYSGDVKLKKARSLTRKYLESLEAGTAEVAHLPPVNPQAETGIYYIHKDVNQAFITMGHQTISYDDPRRHAAAVMNYILGGGGFNSRLTKRVRIDEGLTYSIWTTFTTPVPVTGWFKASASTRLDQAGRTVALMTETLRDFRDNGPTEEEFENAKQSFVNSYVWKYESSDDILFRLTYLKWRGLPLDTPQRDLEAYQSLTLRDVQNAARQLLEPDNLIIVLVGDRDKMDRPLDDFGTVHEVDIHHEGN